MENATPTSPAVKPENTPHNVFSCFDFRTIVVQTLEGKIRLKFLGLMRGSMVGTLTIPSKSWGAEQSDTPGSCTCLHSDWDYIR